MKYLLLLLMAATTNLVIAQSDIVYNKRFVECENKWVAFTKNQKDSTYQYGFIYIDAEAGLTLNLQGSYKIGADGIFIPTKITNTNIKARLRPNQVRVAIIPSSRFKELQIEPVPKWLSIYRSDTTSVAHLVRWGFMYNDFGECAKALTYLEPAQKIDPDFKGLEFELIYAYNALGYYDKAIPLLNHSIKTTPTEGNLYKELGYAQVKLLQLDQAAETYKNAVASSTNNVAKGEIAFNIAGYYYLHKEKEKFKPWAAETKKWALANSQYLININKMESELGLQ